MEQLEVVVLGTGTSAGIPVVACDCAVCTSDDPANKRLRASIWLRSSSTSLLVDCGSDFREQALRHGIKRLDAVLFTHAHSDHVNGMDELRQFNWIQHARIPCWASPITWGNIRQRFEYMFNPMQRGGGVPELDLHTVDVREFTAAGHRVLPVEVMHGLLPVNGFRIGDFAYVTDASSVPPEAIRRLKGVKTLILNALRRRPHPTHLSIDEAVAVADEIGAERVWFTHMTHDLEHHETSAKLPPHIRLGYDGLTFSINPAAPMPEVE